MKSAVRRFADSLEMNQQRTAERACGGRQSCRQGLFLLCYRAIEADEIYSADSYQSVNNFREHRGGTKEIGNEVKVKEPDKPPVNCTNNCYGECDYIYSFLHSLPSFPVADFSVLLSIIPCRKIIR